MARIDLDLLRTNTAAKIVISGPMGTVEGFITDEIALDAAAEHNAPLYSAAQEHLSQAYDRLKAGFGAAGGGGVLPNISPVALEQSVASWTGTSKPSFNLKMVFVAMHSGLDGNAPDDVRQSVMKLYRTVYPTGVSVGKATFLKAPLDYAPQGDRARGTITVAVGKWFRATGQIMKNVSFSFSKQSVQNGTPLYAHGSITFEPFRAVTIADISGYILARNS